MYLHTTPDSALEAQLIPLCLENGYRALLHHWQLRPEHVAISWCLLLLDYFEDVCHELYDDLNNLRIESDAFCASGLVMMGFLLWKEGSGKQESRVVKG